MCIGVIATLGSLALASETTAVEVTIPLPDGPTVRIGGKLGALIAEGHSAWQRKQYDRAISSFTAALPANPDKNVACATYFYRACAYSKKGEPDKALRDWTAAIQLNSKSATTYYNRGHDYGVIGNTDQAIADYTTAIQLNPNYLTAYVNRGNEYAKKRNYKLAIRDGTTAIQLNRKHTNAYHNRGAYYAETGDFDKAIADLSEAIRLDPRSATTFYGRAAVYDDIEQSGKAMADYDRVIRIAPKDADEYAVRGVAHFKRGNYKEAASAFEKALHLFPNNDSALGGLAWVRATSPEAALRDGKEAIRMSTRACELSKWSEQDHLQALAAAYAETGDFDKAVKYQTQAMNTMSMYGAVEKKGLERLALYRAHKPARAEPLVAC